MLVDIGGGTLPHPRADYVIDLHHPHNSPPQDAGVTPWQINHLGMLPSDYVDEVYSSHFMEHIPRGQPLINVMNEAWRVLKPGGTYTMIFPVIGYTSSEDGTPQSNHIGWQPWADPTHVNYWWMPEALMYFCDGPFKAHADYGYRYWAPMGPHVEEYVATNEIDLFMVTPAKNLQTFWSIRSGWEAVARMRKP